METEDYSSNIISAKNIIPDLVPAWAFDIPQARSFRKLFFCHSRFFLFLLTITLLLSVSFSVLGGKTPKIELTTKEQAWLKAFRKIVIGGEMNWAPYDFVDASGGVLRRGCP